MEIIIYLFLRLSFNSWSVGFLYISIEDSDLVHPLTGLSKSFTLLLVHFVETLNGHLARLGIGHTEHIVCLNSSIHSTVAWNRCTELHDFFLWIFWWNTIESSDGFLLRLSLNYRLSGSNQRLSEVFLSFQMSFLLFYGILWRRASIECVLLGCENWLLDKIRISDKFKLKQLQMKNAIVRDTYLLVHVLASIHSDDCGNTFDSLGLHGVVKELSLHGRCVLDMSWLIHSAAEGLSGGSKGRLTIGFSINILRLDAWDISTVAFIILIERLILTELIQTYLEFA